MPKQVQTFTVEFEDGKTYDVAVDQRDIAAWEKHPDWDRERLYTATRVMAYNASRRQGLTKLSEKDWGEQVIEVTTLEGEVGAADPGDPETSGTTSFTSPSSPGSRSSARQG